MEYLSPSEVECLICSQVYPLHKPFNLCRAIRHLKLKHPEQMPEHNQQAAFSQAADDSKALVDVRDDDEFTAPDELIDVEDEYAGRKLAMDPNDIDLLS